MIIPYDNILRLIDAEQEIKKYVENTYVNEWGYFLRFEKANGRHCSFCRAALKNIYLADRQVSGELYLRVQE